jgi:tripartite-type tricarboxylate transporter receptor subunit TctC
MPNVPTVRESGLPDFESSTWFGFVAPAGTPPEVVNRLNAELNKIFSSADAKERLGPQGFDLSPPITPAAFSKLIADDLTRWVPIVKASGAKAD